ncbi:MAG: tetratricopeptide repeat protein [Planctomycetota bacterium]
MNAKLLLGSLLILFATCAGAPATAGDPQRLAEARRSLADGDPDAALAITDELHRTTPDWPDALCVAGEGNLMLATLQRRGLNNELVLQDAEQAFARATELEPERGAAWAGLAEARYQLGRFDDARVAARRAAELQADEARAQAMLLAGRCDLQQLAAARQQEFADEQPDASGRVQPAPETLALAERALQELGRAQQLLPDEAFPAAAQVYQWIDQNDNALLELERGIRSAPQAAQVHTAYQDLHVRMGQQRALAGAYGRFVRENPGQTILLWFQGRAQVVTADDHRQKQAFQPAIDAYRRAATCYREYATKVPAHADSAGQWLAICELSIARTACDMGDLDSAHQHLLAAAAASPAALQYDDGAPALVDSFGSHFAGVVFAIGNALRSGGDADSLRRTLAFHEDIIERFPGRWGFVYNNAALPARDLGVSIVNDLDGKSDAERRAAMAAAMDLWEKSYRWYEEAVRLSPDDPRIVNDCGLMLIYHLNRDFDRARELFERAIAVGEPQLAALPADAPADERRFLEEAVGDAWQNIGVLLSRHLQAPFAEQKPFLEKAVQYYPYRQREAAHMLENGGRETPGNGQNPRSLRGGPQPAPGGGGAPATDAQGGGDEAATLKKAKAEADRLAAEGDMDAALAVLDGVARELRDYAPFQFVRGDLTLRYAREARAAGRTDVEFLFADAAAALQRAVELADAPVPPRVLLAEAKFEQGDLEGALRTADATLLHMQSLGGGEPEQVAAAHRVRANAAARLYIQTRGEAGSKEPLDQARVSFRWLDTNDALDADLARTWATLETWAESPTEAVGVYTRALQRAPDDQALLAGVVDTAYQVGEPALAVEALAAREDAAGAWFLGRARFLLAASLRAGGKLPEALAELDRAIAAFEGSMAANSDYRDSCEQWIAVCLGKKGNVAVAQKDWDAAERFLLAAVALRPDRIDDDLGLQETTKIGVLKLADHFARARELGKVVAIYRAAVESAHSDLDLLNNLGLFARDHGNALERAGDDAEALEMYETSYKAYSRAVELDPQNVRLRNDRALIAIHHLHRDWDQSRALLEQAIRDGAQQLEAMPAGEVQARQDLDEAIGDCWENLALWQLEHGGDAAAAKAAAERSMEHHPGAGRPGARRHLARAETLLQEKK